MDLTEERGLCLERLRLLDIRFLAEKKENSTQKGKRQFRKASNRLFCFQGKPTKRKKGGKFSNVEGAAVARPNSLIQ